MSEVDELGATHAVVEPISERRQRKVAAAVMARLFGGESGEDDDGSPRLFGRYEAIERLGAGAMGEVFLARDPDLDRELAIKILHTDLDSELHRHLLAEAKTMARLIHPNVVSVFDVGEQDEQVFVAMERIMGGTLRQWHDSAKRSWRETVGVYQDAARGLWAAHQEGIIHCDFKPDNVLVSASGEVKVTDFGLARVDGNTRERLAASLGPSSLGSGGPAELDQETLAGLSGTPAYMAPESIRGKAGDARADQFAFFVSMYEALYSERPFAGATVLALLTNIMQGVRQPIPASSVPGRVQAVIERGLQPDPGRRFESMGQVVAELDRCMTPPWRRFAVPLAVAALGASAVVGATLSGATDDAPAPCQGAADRIEPMWNPTRAEQMVDGMVATEQVYAPAVAAEARRRLDDYAARWVEHHTDACEATRVRGEQSEQVLDLRMRCLEQGRRTLGATVDRLRAADDAAVRDGVQLVSALPSVARCDRLDLLDVAFAPPDDPGAKEEIEEFWAQVPVLEAAMHRDGREQTLPAVVALQADADVRGYLPQRVFARMQHARILEMLGDEEQALGVTLDAYRLATKTGHIEYMAHAAGRLAILLGQKLGRHAEASAWAVNAEALAERVDPEGPEHARVLGKVAVALIVAGRVPEAVERFEHELRIWQAQPESAGVELAEASIKLGRARISEGRAAEGIPLIERGLAMTESLMGAEHPIIPRGLFALAKAQERAGELEAAIESHRKAIALQERLFGADHLDVAASLQGLGSMLWETGHPEQALPAFERAVAIGESHWGADDPQLAMPVYNIGEALRAMKEHARALPYYERAVELSRAVDDMTPIVAIDGLVLAYENADDMESALAAQRRSVEMSGRRWGATSLGVARRRLHLAELQWALGRREQAVAEATASLRAARVAGPAAEEAASYRPGVIESPEQVTARAETWLAEHPIR